MYDPTAPPPEIRRRIVPSPPIRKNAAAGGFRCPARVTLRKATAADADGRSYRRLTGIFRTSVKPRFKATVDQNGIASLTVNRETPSGLVDNTGSRGRWFDVVVTMLGGQKVRRGV